MQTLAKIQQRSEKKLNKKTPSKNLLEKASNEKSQSISSSMLLPMEQILGLDSLFEGDMKHLSFDIPTNLRNALNYECRANGDSACKILVKSAALYVVTSRVKKHALGDTLSKILDVTFTIGEVNFTQNCQTRPRRWIRRIEKGNSERQAQLCEIGNGRCKNPAIDILSFEPKGQEPIEYRVCAYHSSHYTKLSVWKFKAKLSLKGDETKSA